MRDDHEAPAQFARIVARPTTPAPPPPMPGAVPAPPPPPPVAAGVQVKAQSVEAKPADAGPPKGWEIDPDQLSAFTHAVDSVRDRLRAVQAKVDRMQTA